MKAPRRQLSIFTMSALDVLAMSTGVFVLLVVLLMPYYRRVHDAHAELEAVRVAEAETVSRVRTIAGRCDPAGRRGRGTRGRSPAPRGRRGPHRGGDGSADRAHA